MKTNNTFSLRRFMLLCRYSLIINKRIIGMSTIGFTGSLFIFLLFSQSANDHFKGWNIVNYNVSFFIFFFIFGLIYTGLSFPAFRSKEKSMHYLMLPFSSLEKFIFELITRVFLFVVLMPILFWMVANLEGSIAHSFIPDFENYKFSFEEAYYKITNSDKNNYWLVLSFIQGGLFVLIFSFAGACHFTKSPLLKTLFSFTIIFMGYLLLSYALYKGLDLQHYNYPIRRDIITNGGGVKTVSFFNNEKAATVFWAYVFTVLNLCFLTISFFRLKEKEV